MAGAEVGKTGTGRRGAAAAAGPSPSRVIKIRGTHEKIAEFDTLSMQGALLTAKESYLDVKKYVESIDEKHFGGNEVFGRYKAAQALKNWGESGRLFLDELKLDRAKYHKVLNAEATMRAFGAWLCETALTSEYAYRRIDPPELESCADGIFKSRIEVDGTRRGFKALTANPRLWFDEREIQMRAPLSGPLRRRIHCVRYTALPRQIQEKDERIGDPKSAKYTTEAEVGVPDGTPIPPGTVFVVLQESKIDEEVAKGVGARYKIVRAGGVQNTP